MRQILYQMEQKQVNEVGEMEILEEGIRLSNDEEKIFEYHRRPLNTLRNANAIHTRYV